MTRQARRAETSTPRAVSPLRDFVRTEAAGGIILVAAAAAAMIWANSPWSSSYERFWTTTISINVGDHALSLIARHWINEGLITIFFFVVGLEIKREVAGGMLATRRAAMLPVAAAIGGMAAPALIYLAISSGSTPRGWAIVVATDIPLALGVLAMASGRVSPTLRVFLLAIAIVDDIGSLLIIAAIYSTGVSWLWLTAAIGVLAIAVSANRLQVQQTWVYIVLGCLLWLVLYEAGVNATLAGVAMGLLAPTTPRIAPELVDVEELADVSTVEAARLSTDIARGSVSVVEWLEHVLHPWASYTIVPLFALANTGVTLSGDLLTTAIHSRITWAIIAARVAGKPLGIMVVSKILIGARRADRPGGAGDREMLGVAASAGMGFTVALFITEIALTDPAQRAAATLAIVVAAVIAAGASLAILTLRRGEPA